MAAVVPIWIPCEGFDVVLSSDDAGPTGLERAVLLFLAQGADIRLEEVVDFLGVGQRLAIDLLTGLWNLGYVLLDANTGAVRLDAYWLDRVQALEWPKIKSARPLSGTVSLMRELVSGQILSGQSTRASAPDEAAPVLVSATLGQCVTRSELAAIALRRLAPGSPLRAGALSLSADSARLSSTSVAVSDWLRLDFEVSVDADIAGSLNLRLAPNGDPKTVGVGPAIADALSAWALDNGQNPLVARLMAACPREPQHFRPSLAARIRGLAAELDRGIGAPLDNQALLEIWPRRLEELAGEVKSLETARGAVTLHLPGAGEPGFLELAAGFKHQVVIAAPTVEHAGLQAFTDTVLETLRDKPLDASAVLLWGSMRQRQLPGPCIDTLKNAASDSRTSEGPRLFAPERSARIASAFAVIDGRRLLYASASPLDGRGQGRFHFMLDITADPPSPIARQVLEIARERASDFAVSERIDLTPWMETGASPSATPVLPSIPAADVSEEGDEASRGLALRAYFHDLKAAALALGRKVERTGSTVQVLSERAAYQQALEVLADADPGEPTLWLGFGRDAQASGGQPLHRALVEAAAERAKRGLPTVVLAHPEVRDGGVDVGPLRALAKARPDMVAVFDTSGLDGHFVCGEQRLLVATAALASPPVIQANRLTNRLIGVLAVDARLCADFRGALAARWPILKPHLVVASDRGSAPAAEAPTTQVAGLVAAWRAAPPGRRRAALAAALGTGATSSVEDLARLLEITTGATDAAGSALRSDVLALAAALLPAPDREQALAEWARTAWADGRWQETAVILRGAGPKVVELAGVPLELADAMAAVDVGLPLATDFLEPHDVDGWMASVAVATGGVLFHGDAIAELLQVKLADPPPLGASGMHEIATAAVTHWLATGAAVDAGRLALMSQHDDANIGLAALASAFADSFHHAMDQFAYMRESLPSFYNEASGLRPVVDLIGEGGTIANQRNALTALLKVFGEGRVDVLALTDRFFEQARKDYGWSTDPAISRGRGRHRSTHETSRDMLRRGLALRDALLAALPLATTDASDELRALLSVLRKQARGLAKTAATMPRDSLARPVLDRFAAQLGGLAGTS